MPFAAFTFRALSGSQSANLAPRFRPRMLASLLVFTTLIAATAAPTLGLGRFGGTAPFGTALPVQFGLATLVIFRIVLTRLPHTVWMTMGAGYFGLRGLVEMFAYRWLIEAGADWTLFMATANVLAWTAFAAWYLPAARLGRPLRALPSLPWGAPAVEHRVVMTADRAAAALLSHGVVEWRRWLAQIVLALLVLWVASLLVSGALEIVVSTFALALPLTAASMAVAEAQRARALWLTHGSRAEIFRFCERRLLRHCTGLTATVAVLGAAAWTAGLVQPASAMWGMAILGSAVLVSTYLGLLYVASRLLDRVIAAVCVVSWLVAMVFVSMGTSGVIEVRHDLLALLVAGQVGAGMYCRFIAMRRWQEIDWLRLRPIRWLTPDVSAARHS